MEFIKDRIDYLEVCARRYIVGRLLNQNRNSQLLSYD